MIEVRDTVRVRPGADDAFQYLVDFRNLPRWDPGIAEVDKTDGASDVGVGSTFDVVATFMGRRVPMRYRVVEHDPRSRRVMKPLMDRLGRKAMDGLRRTLG